MVGTSQAFWSGHHSSPPLAIERDKGGVDEAMPKVVECNGHIAWPWSGSLTVVRPPALVVVEEGREEGRNAEDMSCCAEVGLGMDRTCWFGWERERHGEIEKSWIL
jgi:hypothetical protein